MTVVVAVRTGTRVAMCGDLGIFEESDCTYLRGPSKVHALPGGALLATSGPIEWCHALQTADWGNLCAIDHWSPEDACSAIGAVIQQAMTDAGLQKLDAGYAAGMYASGACLWVFQWPTAVFPIEGEFAAIGSGAPVALGVLAAVSRVVRPVTSAMLHDVVRVTGDYATYVRGVGPVMFTEPETEE